MTKTARRYNSVSSQSFDTNAAVDRRTRNLVSAPKRFVLYDFHEAEPYQQHNLFIRSGYRKGLTFAECARSLFSVHNEFGNVWSHLVAFAFFVGLTVYTLFWMVSHLPLTHKAIFSVFFATALACFLCSTVYHLFSCHSERVNWRVMQFDYQGIGLFIVGSFYPPVFYGFYCYPHLQSLYLAMVTIPGTISVVAPFFERWHQASMQPVRVLLFACTAASGVIPLVHHRFFIPHIEHVFPHLEHSTPTSAIHDSINLMYLMFGIGLVFYLTKFPERWWPGKFDFWFHSHQWWHVFVFLGALVHFRTCLLTYEKWTTYNGECDAMLFQV